ncbi:MAG: FHA domain-containing protein [Myxococcales bacterium]|nr:FHA domain-containing protein [Myxococcales bacterium]
MFKLVIQDDEGKTTVVPLVRDEITIGRKEGNTIRLTERNVSRKHARISRANGAVAIEDLGSYNGVRVNGTRISQRTVLAVSDRVQIGDYLIELKAEGVEAPVPYEDARTQPIERLDPAQLAAAMPAAPMAVPMGLADTDPTARAVAPAAVAAPGGHARIVVLSSNFAGREFQLTKQQMVIGRTDDNDVVINHRSISRNHAKIVREADTGRYTIMDLQSSNGVRVNGEDYGKVELRRGDTIDLGHVRFRFVEAGEDFLFGRDAQIVDVPTGKSKTWIFALLGVVVVGGVIAVVASGGGGGGKKNPEMAARGSDGSGGSAGSAGTPATNPGVAAGPTDPAGSGSDTAPSPGSAVEPAGSGSAVPSVSDNVAALLTEARAAIENNKWGPAAERAAEILALDRNNAEAKTLADQAHREAANSNLYSDFTAAAGRRQYESAVAAFEAIPENSVYKNKARDGYDKLHSQYLSETKRQAASLAKSKRCKDLDKLATEASKVFSDAGAAVRDVNCDDTVAVKPPGGGGGSSGGSGGSSGGSSGGGGSPPPSGDATAIAAEASSAAVNGQYARALSLAEQVIKMSGAPTPQITKAINIAALSACNLKNQAKAKMYYSRATSGAKTGIRQTCLRVAKFDPGAE